MKTSYLSLLFALFTCILMACTPQTTVDDVPDHQPANPKTWSPAGKTYISEMEIDGEYWAYGYKFLSEYAGIRFQTPNKDLTFHEDYMNLVEDFTYKLDYPNLQTGKLGFSIFSDTLTFYHKGLSLTFTLLKL